METNDPVTSAIPPYSSAPSTFAPSFSTAGVTLNAIMEQLQQMDAYLDYLSDEMYQINTRIGHIGGFRPSSSSFPEASTDEDDASFSSDDEITTSQ